MVLEPRNPKSELGRPCSLGPSFGGSSAFGDTGQSLVFLGPQCAVPISASVVTWCPPCVSVSESRFPSSYKDARHMDLGPPVICDLVLLTPAVTLFSRQITL